MNDQEWWELIIATRKNLRLEKRRHVETVKHSLFETFVEAELDREFDDVLE